MILLSLREAAERLGLSAKTLRRLLDQREIPFYRVSKHRKVAQQDLDAYLSKCRIDARPRAEPRRGVHREKHIDRLRRSLEESGDAAIERDGATNE